MSSSQKNKSRRVFLLTIAVFVLPVVLAKLALEFQWFDYGVTNQGTLSAEETTLDDLGIADQKLKDQWLVLYRQPKICDALCESSLLTVNNTYKLLGKELPRVTPVVLVEQPLAETEKSQINHHKWIQLSMPEKAMSHISNKELLIIDPLGNIVMSHKAPLQEEGLNLFSKAILADLKKLLKYSRVG